MKFELLQLLAYPSVKLDAELQKTSDTVRQPKGILLLILNEESTPYNTVYCTRS
jgi:hypothetical protein